MFRSSVLRALFAVSLLTACSSGRDGDNVDEAALETDQDVDVIFSPQAPDKAHTARVARVIAAAQHTLDIAMYSFSDAEISRALEAAVERGVSVRMIFETAGPDARLTGAAKESSKSGRLEAKGIDVRFVNKIMHHKFVIADGPRDHASRAATAKIASGSANWSGSAATRYDENTVFFTKVPELSLRMQREFNQLWEHSRDFALAAPLAQEHATLDITDSMIADADEADVDALFTSANFKVTGTTYSTNGGNTVADALVAAIQSATESIHVSSGHLRSRAVALALMEKKRQAPAVDIRVYLDAQEYISVNANYDQEDRLEACLAAVGSNEAKKRACTDKNFLYGYNVGKTGIDVRYKFYSYRWDASYAKQMHNKFFIFDKKTLFTGSYNLSDNAEHATFENVLVFKGTKYAPLVAAYEATFDKIWETGRGATQARVDDAIRNADTIPLVFDAMALTHQEVTSLKRLLRDNCPLVDSVAYRQDAAGHQLCPRNGAPAAPPLGDIEAPVQ